MMKSRVNAGLMVSATDVIFATVMACGRTVFRATYAGMSSIEDVIDAIRRGAKGVMAGPVTLSLRNGSQGWTVRRTMMRHAAVAEATQLTLF
ncbi:hypothetical protein ED352_10895 [Muribaculaceae bacterium Isolate-002 (NCI)]|nr:hypothetical protein ED352_10895 [Muribaculaceae bacterium Isolate-002 (NCI)]